MAEPALREEMKMHKLRTKVITETLTHLCKLWVRLKFHGFHSQSSSYFSQNFFHAVNVFRMTGRCLLLIMSSLLYSAKQLQNLV
jgi:hypothetical protein